MARGTEDKSAGGPQPAIEWIAPPADLRDLIHTFYVVRVDCERLEEPIPSYSAQLFALIRGEFEIEYSSGEVGFSQSIGLNAPQLRASRLHLKGPVTVVGASLTPVGWMSLTGLPADEVHDCILSLSDIVSPNKVEEIKAMLDRNRSGDADEITAIQALQSLLYADRHPVSPRHRAFVKTVTEWLVSAFNPAVASLYDRIPLSPRQIQRLCRQYFGAPPMQVLKRHRAIRTAMLLTNPDLPQVVRDELDLAYYDQAHMIRDLRRYTGRTPADFAGQSLTGETLDPRAHGKTAAVFAGDHSAHAAER